MSENYGILSLILKHVDVLTLLDLIRYIVDGCLDLFDFVIVTIFFFLIVRLYDFSAILFDTVFQRQIFVIQVLEQDCIFHLVTELLIF